MDAGMGMNILSDIGRVSDSSQITATSSNAKKTPPGSSVGSGTAAAPAHAAAAHTSPSPQVTLKSQLRNRPKSFAQKFRPNSRLAGMATNSYLESPLHEQQVKLDTIIGAPSLC